MPTVYAFIRSIDTDEDADNRQDRRRLR